MPQAGPRIESAHAHVVDVDRRDVCQQHTADTEGELRPGSVVEEPRDWLVGRLHALNKKAVCPRDLRRAGARGSYVAAAAGEEKEVRESA
jgi:hypothetical protein